MFKKKLVLCAFSVGMTCYTPGIGKIVPRNVI